MNELDTFRDEPAGAVSVFAIDRGSGKLKLLQQVSSLGAGPAHLSLDKSARYLLVANYNGGNVAVFPIGDDGRLGRHSAFVQDAGSGVNPERQAGPHAHSIQVTNDNRFAIVADLGLDKLFVYRFDADTGSLTPGSPGFVKVDPGAGPRHVAFAPSGKFVYVVNELASTVTVFAYKPGPGTLHRIQTIPTLPKNFTGKNTAAEIVVDAKGRFLYVSNRGHDSIAVFSIDPGNGKLKSLGVGPERRQDAPQLRDRPDGQMVACRQPGLRQYQTLPDRSEERPADAGGPVVAGGLSRLRTPGLLQVGPRHERRKERAETTAMGRIAYDE